MSDDIENNREMARKEGGLYSVSYLKNNLGMKLKKDVLPRDRWVNNYKKTYAVYSLDDCEVIKPVRERTENQKISSKILVLKNKLNGFKKNKAYVLSKKANDILKSKPFFLDTETTGLGRDDQIIELGIIGCEGEIIFESLYNPTVKINHSAEDIHGIGEEKLKNEKYFSEDAKKIKDILLKNNFVIFNSSFDIGMFRNTYRAFDVDYEFIKDVRVYCAMCLSADFYGATNRYGTISLADAVIEAGLSDCDFGVAHSAVGDCRSMLAVIKAIAGERKNFEDKIKKIQDDILFLENEKGKTK